MVNTTGVGLWFGLTVQFAQCHDHKYDPISQKEYYQIYAFFNKKIDGNIDKYGNADPTVSITWQTPGLGGQQVSAMIMRDHEKAPETYIFVRGDYKKRGDKVSPGVPSFLNVPLDPAHAKTGSAWRAGSSMPGTR